MNKNIKNTLEASNGITLIALVITIIVLLILAGISISMLSGDNSILQKATDAKERTTEGQVKEEISIAWNGVQTEGIINGWKIGKKAEELQKELKKGDSSSTATASGNDINVKNYKGYDATINTTNGSFTKLAKSGGTENPENNKLELTANVKETESRAAIIKVTQEIANATTETELQPMFVDAIKSLGAPFSSWNDISHGDSTMTVETAFNNFNMTQMGYSDVYDLIIKTGANNGVELVYPQPATFTLSGEEPITGTSAEFLVTKNGSYTITASRGGDTGTVTKEVTQCVNRKDNQVEKFAYPEEAKKDAKGNYTLTQEQGGTTYTAVVPAGFAYGTSSNVGTIANGLVITDAIDESTGYSIGNEFVWIPTINKTENDIVTEVGIQTTNSFQEFAKKTSGIDSNENSNFEGILYNFNGINSSKKYSTAFKEPTTIDESFDETKYLEEIGLNKSNFNVEIQERYNSMITGVIENGGFYVGRYEMGYNGSKATSMLGINPISAYDGCTNESTGEGALKWYGLYQRAKTYSNTNVVSNMIWGSQYDAMLNFVLQSGSDSDKLKVTANTNGNHSGSVAKKTGCWIGTSNQTDVITNIFDLEGNLREWTQERNNAYYRTARGGSWLRDNSLADRGQNDAPDTYRNPNGQELGTRLVLHIK